MPGADLAQLLIRATKCRTDLRQNRATRFRGRAPNSTTGYRDRRVGHSSAVIRFSRSGTVVRHAPPGGTMRIHLLRTFHRSTAPRRAAPRARPAKRRKAAIISSRSAVRSAGSHRRPIGVSTVVGGRSHRKLVRACESAQARIARSTRSGTARAIALVGLIRLRERP